MEQAKEILNAYLRVSQHMSRQFRAYFGQQDLTFPQALVLSALHEEGSVPISRLAQLTGSANSTVSGIVDRLERLRLVERTRSEQDRRVIYVALTPECAGRWEDAGPDVAGCLPEMLRRLSQEDLNEILSAFNKLDRALTEAEEE